MTHDQPRPNRPQRVSFIDPLTGKRLRRLDPPETWDTLPLFYDGFGGKFSGDGRRFFGRRRWHEEERPGLRDFDGGLRVWDVATGKAVATLWAGGLVALDPEAVSMDGRAVVIRFYAPNVGIDHIGLWEPDTRAVRWVRPAELHLEFVRFAAGGTRVVLQEVGRATGGIDGFGAGEWAAASGPGPFVVLDAATGKEVLRAAGPKIGPPPLFQVVPTARAVSPDGRFAAVSDYDGTLYLWDLAADRERLRFAHPGRVYALAFSPDGRTLAAAGPGGPVLLYDVAAAGR